MPQEDRNGAATTPPNPPPQLQEVLDAALAAQAAAEAAALAAANTPVAAPTHAATSKATPVDADEIPLVDSAASFTLKRLTWANLKATLIASWQPLADTFGVVKGSSDGTKVLRFEVDGFTSATTRVITPANRDVLMGLLSHGQCRLAKSGANLVLSPFNGNKLIINSQFEDVPDAGVSLAPPATTLTLYYIYAYMSSGTMTLEASATAYAAQAGTGVMVKSGDATRTLVGMARTVTNAWIDTAAQRFVRSWFNDPGVEGSAFFSANRLTGSVTYVELNSEIRNEFLVWSGELVSIFTNGSTFSGAAGDVSTTVGIDSATPEDVVSKSSNYTANASASVNTFMVKSGLPEGYHYATLVAKVAVASATWFGSASSPDRCTLKTRLRR